MQTVFAENTLINILDILKTLKEFIGLKTSFLTF